MHVEVVYPHIEKQLNQPARLQRMPRIRVAQIVSDYLAYGWSADEMCRQHPYLSHAESHAAMAYYYDHQEEIDTEIAAELRQADQDRQAAIHSPLRLRLQARGLL